jgi:hypothetical protein
MRAGCSPNFFSLAGISPGGDKGMPTPQDKLAQRASLNAWCEDVRLAAEYDLSGKPQNINNSISHTPTVSALGAAYAAIKLKNREAYLQKCYRIASRHHIPLTAAGERHGTPQHSIKFIRSQIQVSEEKHEALLGTFIHEQGPQRYKNKTTQQYRGENSYAQFQQYVSALEHAAGLWQAELRRRLRRLLSAPLPVDHAQSFVLFRLAAAAHLMLLEPEVTQLTSLIQLWGKQKHFPEVKELLEKFPIHCANNKPHLKDWFESLTKAINDRYLNRACLSSGFPAYPIGSEFKGLASLHNIEKPDSEFVAVLRAEQSQNYGKVSWSDLYAQMKSCFSERYDNTFIMESQRPAAWNYVLHYVLALEKQTVDVGVKLEPFLKPLNQTLVTRMLYFAMQQLQDESAMTHFVTSLLQCCNHDETYVLRNHIKMELTRMSMSDVLPANDAALVFVVKTFNSEINHKLGQSENCSFADDSLESIEGRPAITAKA